MEQVLLVTASWAVDPAVPLGPRWEREDGGRGRGSGGGSGGSWTEHAPSYTTQHCCDVGQGEAGFDMSAAPITAFKPAKGAWLAPCEVEVPQSWMGN